MLILERVHWNALQKWTVGRLQVGITCEQNNGRRFSQCQKTKIIKINEFTRMNFLQKKKKSE